MEKANLQMVQTSYDTVSAEYARRIAPELDQKPFDRAWLEQFVAHIPAGGLVCDLGCGPGHITQFLAARGVNIFGLDLSAEMLAQARRLNPSLRFQQGNMLDLKAADESWAGIVACYSLIHLPRTEVVAALRECWRVLQPAGQLWLAFHQGVEVLHLDEWWEMPVSLDFTFFQPEEMRGYLAQAGFQVEEVLERPPYPEVEAQTRRVYVQARKPQPHAQTERPG